jgi:hypothetical protein
MKYTVPYDRVKSGYAEMWDQPGVFGVSDLGLIMVSPLSMNFTSSVECGQGRDAGPIYANVQWGLTRNYDAIPVGSGPKIY